MGVLVSFSGIDGAGKSTQVRLISEFLKSKGYKVRTTEEMFGYFLLKPLIKVLRSATGSPSGGPVKRNSNTLAKLWFIPAYIDIWLSYIFRIRPMVSNFDYVIADRFYTDIWANLLYYGYLPQWGFNFFINLLPQPNKAFVFLVDPATVIKREKDFPVTYYQEQSQIYKILTKKVECFVIDANKPPVFVSASIERILNEGN